MVTTLPPIDPTEDFWSRKNNAQVSSFDFAPLGVPTEITANDPQLLAAARLSANRFSQTRERSGQPVQIHLVVGTGTGRPPPDDLPRRLEYAGLGDWIAVSAGEWGHAFANLKTRTACVFLSPALARKTRLVSRYFIDHYVTNFILTEWAMLHASSVLDPTGRRLIVLIAPHNSGKSTTALRLLRAGYTFLADGQLLLQGRDGGFVVGGYPIGEVKLRDDVLASFAEYKGQPVQVREQRKTIIDLRAAHPNRLSEGLVVPSTIQLCFLERGRGPLTQVSPLTAAEALPQVSANTAYWNDAPALAHNTSILHQLLRTAGLQRLKIGTDPDDIRAKVERLR